MASCSGYSRLHRVTPQDLAELTSPGNVVMSPAQVQHALGTCTNHALRPRVAAPLKSLLGCPQGQCDGYSGCPPGQSCNLEAGPGPCGQCETSYGFPDDSQYGCKVPQGCGHLQGTTPSGCAGPVACNWSDLSCPESQVMAVPCHNQLGDELYCCRQGTPAGPSGPSGPSKPPSGGWPSGWPVGVPSDVVPSGPVSPPSGPVSSGNPCNQGRCATNSPCSNPQVDPYNPLACLCANTSKGPQACFPNNGWAVEP